MTKRVIFSVKQKHPVIQRLLPLLEDVKDIEFILHDPTKNFFSLEEVSEYFENVDAVIAKVRGDNSIDLLHFAKMNDVKALHDVDTILKVNNKVALDYALRETFRKHPQLSKEFKLPFSWNQHLKKRHVNGFKTWLKPKLPVIIKSHYQHDKFMRFTFLVKKIEEIDYFFQRYEHLMHYDLYIQEFIECDGKDRKVYVIGDNMYGIERESPVYLFMRSGVNKIDVHDIKRASFPLYENLRTLARALSEELHLKIFGFDLLKATKGDFFYLVDVNDFPGFRKIEKVESALADYLIGFIRSHC